MIWNAPQKEGRRQRDNIDEFHKVGQGFTRSSRMKTSTKTALCKGSFTHLFAECPHFIFFQCGTITQALNMLLEFCIIDRHGRSFYIVYAAIYRFPAAAER